MAVHRALRLLVLSIAVIAAGCSDSGHGAPGAPGSAPGGRTLVGTWVVESKTPLGLKVGTYTYDDKGGYTGHTDMGRLEQVEDVGTYNLDGATLTRKQTTYTTTTNGKKTSLSLMTSKLEMQWINDDEIAFKGSPAHWKRKR